MKNGLNHVFTVKHAKIQKITLLTFFKKHAPEIVDQQIRYSHYKFPTNYSKHYTIIDCFLFEMWAYKKCRLHGRAYSAFRSIVSRIKLKTLFYTFHKIYLHKIDQSISEKMIIDFFMFIQKNPLEKLPMVSSGKSCKTFK